MNRVCRTEGHDYPTFAPQINGVPQIKGVSESSIITGPCRRCGLDALLDPAILSKRLTELTRNFRQFRHAVDVGLTAIDDRLTALENAAKQPVTLVNNAASATEGLVEAAHIAYREGRLTAWQDLRDYAAKQLVVAENAPGMKKP